MWIAERKLHERVYDKFPIEVSECGSKFNLERVAELHKMESEICNYK